MDKNQRLQRVSENYEAFLKKYEELPVNDKEALRTKVLSGSKTLKEWQKQLEAYLSMGNIQPKAINLHKDSSLPSGCIVLIFAGIMFFILGAVLGSIGFFQKNGKLLGQVIVGGSLVSIIPFLYSGYFKRYRIKKAIYKTLAVQIKQISGIATIPNEALKNFVMPLLQFLNEEVPSDRSVELQVDFRDKIKGEFVYTPENMTSGWSYYKVPWFVIKPKLADSTLMHIQINYLIRFRRYSKRSRSGKLKTKTKTKVRLVYELTTHFSKKQYKLKPQKKNKQQLVESNGFKIKESDKKIVLKGKAMQKNLTLDSMPDLTQVVLLAQKAYSQIQPHKG